MRDYFRDAHAVAARIGMVDVNVLKVDGRPAAFLYGYHHHGHVSALRTGFDASLEDGGIGFALMLKSIEDSSPAATGRSTSAPANANTNAACARASNRRTASRTRRSIHGARKPCSGRAGRKTAGNSGMQPHRSRHRGTRLAKS